MPTPPLFNGPLRVGGIARGSGWVGGREGIEREGGREWHGWAQHWLSRCR